MLLCNVRKSNTHFFNLLIKSGTVLSDVEWNKTDLAQVRDVIVYIKERSFVCVQEYINDITRDYSGCISFI